MIETMKMMMLALALVGVCSGQGEAELIDLLNESTSAHREKIVETWIGDVRSLQEKARIYLEAFEVMKKNGIEEAGANFLEWSAVLLYEEAALRKQWRAMVKMPMLRKHREEAGEVWVALTKRTDEIADFLEDRELASMNEKSLQAWKRSREAPRPPEPEIIEE